jgi:hypothetical protein
MPRRLIGEFFHRRCADEPSSGLEKIVRLFEEIFAALLAGEFTPAVAENAAVDRCAHMANHVGFHFFLNSLVGSVSA